VRRIPTGFDDLLAENSIHPRPVRLRRTLDGVPVDASASPGSSELATSDSADNPENSNVSFLAGEVVRSLAFFSREFPEVTWQQKLVILGEDAVAARLCSLLKSAIPVPVVHESPKFDYNSGAADTTQAGSAYQNVVAIGASLGSAVTTVPVLNLAHISEASRMRRKAPAALLAGMSASTIWMAAAIIASGVLTFLTSQKLKESADITNSIASIKAERAPMLIRQQTWDAAQVEKSKSQVPGASVMGRVAVSATPGVALTSLKVTPDGKVTLEGKAANTDKMQSFADALGRGKAIKSPTFEAMHKDPKEGFTFRIVGAFRTVPTAGNKPSQFQ
jgi:Tfp pilus assembly protein PilN